MHESREPLVAVYMTRTEAIALGSTVLAYCRYLNSLQRPTEAQRFIAAQLAKFHDRMTRQMTGRPEPKEECYG